MQLPVVKLLPPGLSGNEEITASAIKFLQTWWNDHDLARRAYTNLLVSGFGEFHVQYKLGVPILYLLNDNNTTLETLVIATYGATASIGNQNNVHFVRGGGTAASPTATQNGDLAMSIGGRGIDNNGAVTNSATAYQLIALENFTTTAQGMKHHFEATAAGSATRTSVLDIAAQGIGLLDGSAGSPAFFFTSETGSGLYRNASNNVRMAIGGSDRFTWTSTQIIAIGSNANWVWDSSGEWPNSDNVVTSGKSGNRWSAVWAANGTIQTSMLRTKKNVVVMKPEECRIPEPIYFNRIEDNHSYQQLGFAADNLPEESHPIINTETGERAKDEIYTDSVLAMLCLAARNDYERFSKLEARIEALEKKLSV